MVNPKSERELLFYGFELDVLKRQCAKYVRLNCKRMIQLFFHSIIESAQKKCTVEMLQKIQDLSDNYMQIIKVDLIKLIKLFDDKIDKYLTIPSNVILPCDNVATGDDGDADELIERINELETIYQQQAILMQKLRAEMEFYNTVMDVQAEIDDGLCLLTEKYMRENGNEMDGDKLILELLNNVLDAKNCRNES